MPKLKTIFNANKNLSLLCSRVSEQLAVLQSIKAVLPKNLANHALHCVINGNKLLLYTDSAIWASQLRFYDRAILAAAIAPTTTKPVALLQVKVLSAFTGISRKKRAYIPSQLVVDEIRANSCAINDPELKQALGKLSATLARLQAK
jgi:hypothetical protein